MIQWNIHQQISIGQLRVESVSNASVLQIGSAGSIRALTQLNNSGGFTGPVASLNAAQDVQMQPPLSLVPLPNPT